MWANTTTRAMLMDRGIVLGDIYEEYIAGATFTALGRRYGVSPSALCKLMASFGEEGWAAKARDAREAAMQDKIARIAGIAGRVFRLKPGEIWRGGQRQQFVVPRFAAWLVAVENGASLAGISRAFECDHTTVMHGRDKARDMEARDDIFATRIARVRREAA